MIEYISRDEALSYKLCDGISCHECTFFHADITNICGVAKYIESIPAADVRPVVRGKILYDAKHDRQTCSVCGCEHIMIWYKENTYLDSPVISSENMNFCPNCGADLRKDKRNETK